VPVEVDGYDIDVLFKALAVAIQHDPDANLYREVQSYLIHAQCEAVAAKGLVAVMDVDGE
jgi:hypothetical protein